MGSRNIVNADWFALRDATVRSKKVNNDRIDLYFKLWKLCAPYFISLKNFKLYVGFDIKLNKAYSRVFQDMRFVDTSDIYLPQLDYFMRNNDIDNYLYANTIM
ncbi:unnamed protein product [Ambrosiozyma monospora]|nr:unnamed protein product [Ambrosiozyma monospora]